ncbi:hypothetical protein BR93DRAFT_559948 [Coniochaeta sp. PMI_546]|nr:hypothetical protein BR93DRAFT_559948 [Coniochaeta sp. PMI_546]
MLWHQSPSAKRAPTWPSGADRIRAYRIAALASAECTGPSKGKVTPLPFITARANSTTGSISVVSWRQRPKTVALRC